MKLFLKRLAGESHEQFCLVDENDELLPGQTKVTLKTGIEPPNKIIVEFREAYKEDENSGIIVKLDQHIKPTD